MLKFEILIQILRDQKKETSQNKIIYTIVKFEYSPTNHICDNNGQNIIQWRLLLTEDMFIFKRLRIIVICILPLLINQITNQVTTRPDHILLS